MKLCYFINAFSLFWWFLFWLRSNDFNNHFPDLWKPLMNLSRFSFQVRNSKNKWIAFNRPLNSTVIRRKNLPCMSPLNFWNFVPGVVLQIVLILFRLAWPLLTILKIEFHLIVNVMLLLYQSCFGLSQKCNSFTRTQWFIFVIL